MNKLEKYYEKIKLGCTADEFTEKVIAKSNTSKKRISSKFIGVAAAAVAVMTLGVTAAASSLGYFDIFSTMFGEKAENLANNIVEEVEIIRNDVTERMDFELVAAAADKHGVLIILDVTAKNGFKLGDNYIGDARADFWYKLNPNPDSSGAGNMFLVEGNENKARIRLSRTCSEDITGREVILTVGEFSKPQIKEIGTGEDSVCPNHETDKQWQVKFIANGESLEYEVDGVKISVSPISVMFDVNEHHFSSYDSALSIITKSGKVKCGLPAVVTETDADGNCNEKAIFRVNEPINPEEVTALEVNGRRFDLK